MSCTALGANPEIGQILWCALELGAGGAVFAGILLFAFMIYAMYKLRVPFVVQVPLGIFVLFVFAGAGSLNLVVGGFTQFTTMMWIVISAVGAITVLVFWKLRR